MTLLRYGMKEDMYSYTMCCTRTSVNTLHAYTLEDKHTCTVTVYIRCVGMPKSVLMCVYKNIKNHVSCIRYMYNEGTCTIWVRVQ